MQPTTIITGNLTADPELCYLDSGRAVANFSIAHNPRRLDENSGEWVDGTPTFLRAELWGPTAENAAISLTSGTRVLAVVTLRTRRWTSGDGERRQAMSLVVDEIGPTLRWATRRGDPHRRRRRRKRRRRGRRRPRGVTVMGPVAPPEGVAGPFACVAGRRSR